MGDIHIHLKKQHLVILISLISLFGIVLVTNAYGNVYENPEIMGHSLGELDFSQGQANSNFDLGGNSLVNYGNDFVNGSGELYSMARWIGPNTINTSIIYQKNGVIGLGNAYPVDSGSVDYHNVRVDVHGKVKVSQETMPGDSDNILATKGYVDDGDSNNIGLISCNWDGGKVIATENNCYSCSGSNQFTICYNYGPGYVYTKAYCSNGALTSIEEENPEGRCCLSGTCGYYP